MDVKKNGNTSSSNRRSLRAILRRFGLDQRGVTIIEFAMLAPVLLYLLLGTLELALMYASEINVEGAVSIVARQIRTGQTQNSGNAVATFQANLCTALTSTIKCGDVLYDVRTFNDFGSITFALQYDVNGDLVMNDFSPGAASEIVVIRVVYDWVFVTPFMGTFFGTADANGSRRMIITAVFRNEPYE